MTTPTKSMGLAQHYLANMIADSPSFRTWVGAADQAEALARIYHDALPPVLTDLASLQALRPFALVWTDPQKGFNRSTVGEGATRSYNSDGVIAVYFEDNVDTLIQDDPTEIGVRLKNNVESVQSDLDGFNGVAGYLAYNEIRKIEGPSRAEEDERPTQGDFMFLVWQVIWEGL